MEDYLFSQLNKRSYSVLEVEYKSRVKAIVENMKDVDNFELRRKLLGRKIKLEFLTFGPLSLLQSQAIRDKLENEQKRILAEASFEYEQKLKEKLELEKEEGRKSEAEVNEY